jgi:CheY-like chemotaxis protein
LIVQICAYLDRYITDVDIDIELLQLGQHASEVKLKVNIKGSHPDKHVILAFVRLRQDDIISLLKALPYPTKFSHGDPWLHFSFFISFFYSGQPEDAIDTFGKKKILLVEENELTALTFITIMEEWKCHVTKVTSAFSAIEEVKFKHYHIVLIDIHSAAMHGIECIQKIRSFDKHIPIIGLTSPWSKGHVLDAYAAGVSDILAKPVSSSDLQKILQKYI